MTRASRVDRTGEVICDDHDEHELWIRGHLSHDDAAEVVSGYDTGQRLAGPPFWTWGHAGFGHNEDGDFVRHLVYLRQKPRSKRGWFAVTVAAYEETPE